MSRGSSRHWRAVPGERTAVWEQVIVLLVVDPLDGLVDQVGEVGQLGLRAQAVVVEPHLPQRVHCARASHPVHRSTREQRAQQARPAAAGRGAPSTRWSFSSCASSSGRKNGKSDGVRLPTGSRPRPTCSVWPSRPAARRAACSTFATRQLAGGALGHAPPSPPRPGRRTAAGAIVVALADGGLQLRGRRVVEERQRVQQAHEAMRFARARPEHSPARQCSVRPAA